MELLSRSALGNKSSSKLKALPMSLSVVPHAVEPTKRSVPIAEITTRIPSGKYFYLLHTQLIIVALEDIHG